MSVLNFVLFFRLSNRKFTEVPKMCLKQSFSYSKWDLQPILYMTVLSNCVSGSSNFDSDFLPNCTKSCSVF